MQEGSLPLTWGGEVPRLKALPVCRSKWCLGEEGKFTQSSISLVFKKNKQDSCGTILVMTIFIIPKECCFLGWQTQARFSCMLHAEELLQ